MKFLVPTARRTAARLVTWALVTVAPLAPAAAQHPQHPARPRPPARDTARPMAPPPLPPLDHLQREHTAGMDMTGPLGIPLSREGSGTSWLPDASPMHAVHAMRGAWSFMLHGNAFLQYVSEGGARGDEQLSVTDWLMAMAGRRAAGGMVTLHAMVSTDPATVGRCGYPDLLATGETCRGQRLRDRQHPHDLFMELAASYQRELGRDLALQLYGGPAGEPALGPVAYPHRISALPNPIAPIGHHWLDATHISFGVVTAGLFGRRWKLEASVFNGREPDEERYDLDLGRLDSYAGRLWLLPGARWALQVSAGRLIEVEADPAGGARTDITRTTASATYHVPRGAGHGGIWATTVAWGRNSEPGHASDAVLAETHLSLADRDRFFASGEAARKSGEDLDLGAPALDEELFTIGKLTLGYERRVTAVGALTVSAGARVAVSLVPARLSPFYGSRSPAGLALLLNLRQAAAPPMLAQLPGGGEPHHGAGQREEP